METATCGIEEPSRDGQHVLVTTHHDPSVVCGLGRKDTQQVVTFEGVFLKDPVGCLYVLHDIPIAQRLAARLAIGLVVWEDSVPKASAFATETHPDVIKGFPKGLLSERILDEGELGIKGMKGFILVAVQRDQTITPINFLFHSRTRLEDIQVTIEDSNVTHRQLQQYDS